MRRSLGVIVVALCASCGGSGNEGSSSDPLCWDYHPHPISQPDRTDEWCEPEGWVSDVFSWRTGEACEQAGTEHVGSMAIRDRSTGWHAGEEVSGCHVRFDCYAEAIDNPACCDGIAYDGGVANCD